MGNKKTSKLKFMFAILAIISKTYLCTEPNEKISITKQLGIKEKKIFSIRQKIRKNSKKINMQNR